jgi:hypothetical protein
MVRPAKWKGQAKKRPWAKQILATLRPGEADVIEELAFIQAEIEDPDRTDKDLVHPAHNTLDAVGIGLYFMGRLKVGGGDAGV